MTSSSGGVKWQVQKKCYFDLGKPCSLHWFYLFQVAHTESMLCLFLLTMTYFFLCWIFIHYKNTNRLHITYPGESSRCHLLPRFGRGITLLLQGSQYVLCSPGDPNSLMVNLVPCRTLHQWSISPQIEKMEKFLKVFGNCLKTWTK